MARYRLPVRTNPLAWLFGRAVLVAVVLFAAFGVFHLTRGKSPTHQPPAHPLVGKWVAFGSGTQIWDRVEFSTTFATCHYRASGLTKHLEYSAEGDCVFFFGVWEKFNPLVAKWSIDAAGHLTLEIAEFPAVQQFKRAD